MDARTRGAATAGDVSAQEESGRSSACPRPHPFPRPHPCPPLPVGTKWPRSCSPSWEPPPGAVESAVSGSLTAGRGHLKGMGLRVPCPGVPAVGPRGPGLDGEAWGGGSGWQRETEAQQGGKGRSRGGRGWDSARSWGELSENSPSFAGGGGWGKAVTGPEALGGSWPWDGVDPPPGIIPDPIPCHPLALATSTDLQRGWEARCHQQCHQQCHPRCHRGRHPGIVPSAGAFGGVLGGSRGSWGSGPLCHPVVAGVSPAPLCCCAPCTVWGPIGVGVGGLLCHQSCPW